jgi:phosphotransferase system  glucose/maltose/N-acetylglucosamine-specific IIC component
MMICDADFEELFPDQDAGLKPKARTRGPAQSLHRDDAGQHLHDPLQATAALAMMSPFGAALAMMSAFDAPKRT